MTAMIARVFGDVRAGRNVTGGLLSEFGALADRMYIDAISKTGWHNAFVGLPYREGGSDRDGVWCWGIPVLVYREVLGIELPTYTDDVASAAERAEIAALMARDSAAGPWRPVERGQERAFDIVLFNRAGMLSHAGVVVRPGMMLHVHVGQTSRLERYDTGLWAPRLAGIWRHAELD